MYCLLINKNFIVIITSDFALRVSKVVFTFAILRSIMAKVVQTMCKQIIKKASHL